MSVQTALDILEKCKPSDNSANHLTMANLSGPSKTPNQVVKSLVRYTVRCQNCKSSVLLGYLGPQTGCGMLRSREVIAG